MRGHRKYKKEYSEGRAEKYLRTQLSPSLVLFKYHIQPDQVNYYLFKAEKAFEHPERIGEQSLVAFFDPDFLLRKLLGYAAFLFQAGDSVYVGSIDVDLEAQRKGVATWLLKRFLEEYYRGLRYPSIHCEARTVASKALFSKMGFRLISEDSETGFWQMATDHAHGIMLPRDCSIETLERRLRGVKPRIVGSE